MLRFNESIVYKDNVIQHLPEEIPVSPGGLGIALYHCMKKNANNVAQIIAETGEEQLYSDLLQSTVRLALWLKSQNIGQDDLVAICSHNQKDTAVPYLGALLSAIPVVGLEPELAQVEFIHLLDSVKTNLKVIFVSEECADIIEKSLTNDVKIVVFGKTKDHIEFDECIKKHPDEDTFEPTFVNDLKQTAFICFSSGTTSLAKPICLSHYSGLSIQTYSRVDYEDEVNLPLLMQDYAKLKDGTIKYLTFGSLFVISACMAQIGLALNGGARVVVKKFDPKETWYLIDKYKVNILTGLPFVALSMAKVKPNDVDVTSLIRIILTGAPITREQLRFVRDSFPQSMVLQAWGQTECAGMALTFNPSNKNHMRFIKEKEMSCGYPVPGYSYKIVDVDDTSKALGPNEKGELWLKSKGLLNGYLNRSNPVIDENGWYRSGDIMYYDEDYCFYFEDRLSESIKYKGFKVEPVHVEKELLKNPAIREVAVIGVPNLEDGYHFKGLVVLNEGAKMTADDVVKYIEERLPVHLRLLSGAVILDEFPRTPLGKIDRKKLKAIYSTTKQ